MFWPRRASNAKPVRVEFMHGLGDCVHFAHQIPVYRRRGVEVEVVCAADKAPLFLAAGASVSSSREGAHVHLWSDPPAPNHVTVHDWFCCNKAFHAFSIGPLPKLPLSEDLWKEDLRGLAPVGPDRHR